MGTRELIASLHAGAEEKARTLREKAAKEAEDIVSDTERRIAELRAAKQQAAERSAGERAETVLAAARAEARRMGFEMERVLADRLYGASTRALPILRDGDYPGVFGLLVKEIPSRNWTKVRVNPLDAASAREMFPGAAVVGDESVSGGLEVSTEGEMIKVDNTFEKRLERAWGDLVPELMASLEKEREHEGP